MNTKTFIHDSHLSLRFAEKEDVPLIFDFIKQLSVYEKLAHEVTANIDLLKQSLFGDRPVAEVIIADFDNAPAAFALYFHNYSTFLGKPGLYLEDLFVKPEMRGKGIGKTILTFLAKLAVDRGCERFEWWVLDWNDLAVNFYRNLGAESMDEWTVFRLTGDTLIKLANESNINSIESGN